MFSLEDLIVTTLSFVFMLINNNVHEEIKSALNYQYMYFKFDNLQNERNIITNCPQT